MPVVPQGYSGATAVALVQGYSNEFSIPTTAQILQFLNIGLEQVVRRVGGIKLYGGYPTVNNQTTVSFNDDVQEIISANFSYGSNSTSNSGTASPFSVGAMVNPMEQSDQKEFYEAAAGFPNVGFGPPRIFFVYQDQGTAPTQTLPVPPQSVMAQIAGTGTAGTVEAGVTYVNANGETTIGPVSDQATTTTELAQMQSPPAVSNASGYNTYAGAVGGPYHLQNASPIALGFPFTIPKTLLTVTLPPVTNTAIGAGTGGALSAQVYPSAMIGQMNIFYKARPLLWADTTTASWTNFDSSAQEAAILFAVMRVLAVRQRSSEIAPWRKEYEGDDGNGGMIASLKETLAARTVQKSGQVRDVRGGYGVRGFIAR